MTGNVRLGYSPLWLELGVQPMAIQAQAQALPGYALVPIHGACMNTCGTGFSYMTGMPMAPMLAMGSPSLMMPVMSGICGSGYAQQHQNHHHHRHHHRGHREEVDLGEVGWGSSTEEKTKMERALKNNPRARSAFEASVGGRIVDFGQDDGKLTIERFPPACQPTGPFSIAAINPSAMVVSGMLGNMTVAVDSNMIGAGYGPFSTFVPGASMLNNSFLPMSMLGFGNVLGNMGGLGVGPFSFNTMSGAGMGSLNPMTAPGHINNTNPGYEQAHQNQVAAILNDPSLSVEDKVMLMLCAIMKKMDDDIEKQMQYINSLQNQQANRGGKGGGQKGGGGKSGGGGGKGGKAGGGKSSPSVDVEMQKLQRMITKRAQLFEMASNIMKKYDDTARAAIQKIQ